MSEYSRRQFLGGSGAVLAGLAMGPTITSARESDERFIVETRGKGSLGGSVSVVHDMPEVGLAVVEASERDLRRSRAVKRFQPDVEYGVADPSVQSVAADESTVDGETFYPFQWDKQDLDIASAHETTTGEGTSVAIIDSGVAAGHPDLTVNTEDSKDFTGDGYGAGAPYGGYHGTHVAGIVAALDNDMGVIGTAPATDLRDYRVFSATGGADFGDVLAAVHHAGKEGVDVANLSLGAYPVPRQGLGSFYGKYLNKTMTYANSQGTLLTISTGNDAADLQHDKSYISIPNEGAQACQVAATGPIGFMWGDPGLEAPEYAPAIYTNYGTNAVTLAAPGGNYDPEAAANGVPGWYFDLVLSTVAEPVYDGDGNYLGATYSWGWAAGTSMAAPQVAGAAALVKSANPGYNANQVESALKRAASVPAGYDKAYYGAGYLDVNGAL